jgi:hypothetical protein
MLKYNFKKRILKIKILKLKRKNIKQLKPNTHLQPFEIISVILINIIIHTFFETID